MVQPAPRMTTAPIPNRAICQGLGHQAPPGACPAALARAMPHQHGSSSSQVPIGRSRRISPQIGTGRRRCGVVDPGFLRYVDGVGGAFLAFNRSFALPFRAATSYSVPP